MPHGEKRRSNARVEEHGVELGFGHETLPSQFVFVVPVGRVTGDRGVGVETGVFDEPHRLVFDRVTSAAAASKCKRRAGRRHRRGCSSSAYFRHALYAGGSSATSANPAPPFDPVW
jgi:hypothetical protein